MLRQVLQRFLQDSEQTKPDLFWHVFRNLVRMKLDVYPLRRRKLPAKSLRRRNQTSVLQGRRVQTVRHSLDVVDQFRDTSICRCEVCLPGIHGCRKPFAKETQL